MSVFKRTLTEYLYRRFVLKQFGSDLLFDLQIEAKKETVAYINSNMSHALYFEKHKELLAYSVDLAVLPGLCLEFGVGRGKSIRWIAKKTSRTIYGFDSFDGIPESWNGNPMGAFSQKKLPKVPKNVIFKIGMFENTLTKFIQDTDQAISFLHIDCDLYSSAVTVFKILGNRLQKGSIILFDEYYNFPGWKDHEFRAFQEFTSLNNIKYEYIAYSVTGQQVAVKITDNPLIDCDN